MEKHCRSTGEEYFLMFQSKPYIFIGGDIKLGLAVPNVQQKINEVSC